MELSTKLSITSDGAVMGFFLLRFGAFFEDKIVYVPFVFLWPMLAAVKGIVQGNTVVIEDEDIRAYDGAEVIVSL